MGQAIIFDVLAKYGERISFTNNFRDGNIVYFEFRDPLNDAQGFQEKINQNLKYHQIEKIEIQGCTMNVHLSKTGLDSQYFSILEMIQKT